jgi:ribose 5-phosphate isomerase B
MLALEILDTWLGTEFSHNERHQRRIDKVMALENA